MPRKAAGVAQLRQLVRQRVDASSIRVVAEEIGMSPSGLHVFLEGSRPHPGTIRKITDWLRRTSSHNSVDERDVDAAIVLLRSYLDRDTRPDIRSQKLADIVDRLS